MLDPQAIQAALQPIVGGATYYYDSLGKFNLTLKTGGALSFPLNALQVEALLARARQAPFGKGHQTLVDREVRDTREVDADQLRKPTKASQQALDDYLDRAARAMNIDGKIKAVPYKLLVYGPGGFFKEHQDSEKLPGMFGTLLIGLPSAHEGGELILHPGDGAAPVSVDFSENDAADFPAIAFFADRKHEVLPVTKGFRVVMVYNLVYSSGKVPLVPDLTLATERLADTLREARSVKEPVILCLEHQYTDTNFSSTQLKGSDAARVRALRTAAREAGMELRVGLIDENHISEWENADAFGQGYDDRSYRRRRSGWYQARREPTKFSELDIGYDIDGHLFIGNWLAEDGPSLGQLRIDEEEITKPATYKAEEPIEWSAEGYQGNWGMDVNFTYRYGAVVLWPAEITGKLLAKLPLSGQLEWANKYAKQTNDPREGKTAKERLADLMTGIMTTLHRGYDHNFEAKTILPLLTAAGVQPADRPRWIVLLFRNFEKVPPAEWPALVAPLGEPALEHLLHAVGTHPTWSTASGANTLSELLEKKDNYPNWRQKDGSPERMVALVAALAALHAAGYAFAGQLWGRLPEYCQALLPKAVPATVVGVLLKHAPDLPTTAKGEAAIAHFLLERNATATGLTQLGQALLEAPVASPLFTALRQGVLARLGAAEPQPYPDMARPEPKAAPSYPFREYNKLIDFLRHPKHSVLEIKAPENSRKYVENFVTSNKLDLDCSTLRTRPSYTLRLVKNDRSYQTALAAYRQNVDLIGRLNALAPLGARDSQPARVTAFVRELVAGASRAVAGVTPAEVRQAAKAYATHFADRASGAEPASVTLSELSDRLLDHWEAEIAELYEEVSDDGVWAAAFTVAAQRAGR